MFLSGLDNIDFSGLGSMSGDMSESQLFAAFRSAMPATKAGFVGNYTMSDSLLHSIISAVLGRYEIRKIQIPDSEADGIEADVKRIIIGIDAVNGYGYADEINAVVQNLKNNGYSLVLIGSHPQSMPTAIPVKSELVDPSNIAAAGALAVGRSGASSPSSTLTQSTPSAPSGSISDTIQSGIKSILAAWPKSAPAGPTQYIRAPHTQTAAEKQRLILIVGGFGLAFVLTIGIIAARNND